MALLKLRRDLDKAHTAMQTLLPGEVADKEKIALRVINERGSDKHLHRNLVEKRCAGSPCLRLTERHCHLASLFLSNRRLRTEMRMTGPGMRPKFSHC